MKQLRTWHTEANLNDLLTAWSSKIERRLWTTWPSPGPGASRVIVILGEKSPFPMERYSSRRQLPCRHLFWFMNYIRKLLDKLPWNAQLRSHLQFSITPVDGSRTPSFITNGPRGRKGSQLVKFLEQQWEERAILTGPKIKLVLAIEDRKTNNGCGVQGKSVKS